MIVYDPKNQWFYCPNECSDEEIADADSKLVRLSQEHLIWSPPSQPRMQGLGDVVKKVTDALGIKQCGGCQKRQNWLNNKFPFGHEKTP